MKPIQQILMLGILSFFGCKSTKSMSAETTPEAVAEKFKYNIGPCFGECPVYTLTVLTDGTLKYQGEKFTEKLGVWENKLNNSDYKELIKLIERANLSQYPDNVPRLISDIPDKTMTFSMANEMKTLNYSYIKDQPILDIEERMTELTKLAGWTQIRKPVNTSGYPDYFITDEIIIKLKKGVDAKAFAQRYAKQGGEIIKSVSPPYNMWLFKYREGTMTAKEMMTDIKAQPEIVEAEFNKKLEMRTRE